MPWQEEQPLSIQLPRPVQPARASSERRWSGCRRPGGSGSFEGTATGTGLALTELAGGRAGEPTARRSQPAPTRAEHRRRIASRSRALTLTGPPRRPVASRCWRRSSATIAPIAGHSPTATMITLPPTHMIAPACCWSATETPGAVLGHRRHRPSVGARFR